MVKCILINRVEECVLSVLLSTINQCSYRCDKNLKVQFNVFKWHFKMVALIITEVHRHNNLHHTHALCVFRLRTINYQFMWKVRSDKRRKGRKMAEISQSLQDKFAELDVKTLMVIEVRG